MSRTLALMSLHKLLTAVVVAAILPASAYGQANLLINGGFEIPASNFQSIYPGQEPSGFGWTVEAGDIEVFLGFSSGYVAVEGVRLTDTTGVSAGRFSQVFQTQIGSTYSLMFAYSNNPQWPPASLNYNLANAQTSDLNLAGSVFHGSATFFDADWDYLAPLSFVATGTQTKLTFQSLAGGAGGVVLDDVVVFEGGVHTPGSLPIRIASSTDDAFVIDQTTSSSTSGTGVTIEYNNLDLIGDSSYELLPLDTLCLDNGNGTLFVGPDATFTGNGIVKGHIVNQGLVRIPIAQIGSVGGGVVIPILPPPAPPGPPGPPSDPLPPIPPETIVIFTGSGGGWGSGGGGYGGGGFGGDNGGDDGNPPPEIPIPGPCVCNEGTLKFDASLEVTGSYVQTATGALRLFIGGDEPGVTYSQLLVGEEVTLDGRIQVVLEPELFDDFMYSPQVGDMFDFVISDIGITILPGLEYEFFVMADQVSLLSNYSLNFETYNSGISSDPDALLRITDTLFSFSLVNDGRVLRATLTEELFGATVVPTPSALVASAAMMAGLLLRRRR